MSYVKEPVGEYLVIGSERRWKVMEQFGAFRMFKRTFTTQAKARQFAEQLPDRP